MVYWNRQCPNNYRAIPVRFWKHADQYRALDGRQIDPLVAVCLSGKETEFCNFTGEVPASHNNLGGLGATGGVKGHSFPNLEVGVHAVLQHLWAYATDQALPVWISLVDPRFREVNRGSSAYVETLGAADNPTRQGWAEPGRGYGFDVAKRMEEVRGLVI